MKKSLIVLFFVFSITQASAQYMFVFLNKKADAEVLPKEKVDELMKGHMSNMERLAIEGKLLVAGPFDGGGGIFILNTTSKEEGEQWLSTDPGIQAKRWNVEMFPYKVTVGKLCKAPEPYQMVTYVFLRYDAIVSKFNANTYPEIINKHNEYVKQLAAGGNVITAGIFGDYDGGIVIMKGEVSQEVIDADPGVQEGLLEVTQKKLWIAKGSFCEQ